MIKGKVFFIGTGPGDPSLLTLKAKKCLEHADLLLYEPSIHPNLLYYGKEGAKCSLLPKTQVSLRKILLNQTKEGNSVALLLHGDGISNPLCQEGKTFLTLHRTPYEIVPGILEPAIDSIKKPLAGIRIFVLRSVDQSQNLMEDLTTLGADVIQCPMIEVIPITKILQTIKKSFLKDFTMLIFTSANGVRFFMETLLEKKMDARILSNKKIITIGPKTKESLKEYGIIADAMPEKFVAESILDQLNDEIRGEKILIPTASGARAVLPEELKKRGAEVVVLKIYKNVMPHLSRSISLQDGDLVIFTSSSTAIHFFTGPLYRDQKIIPFCIGEITKKTVLKYLHGKKIYTSKKSTAESLATSILEYVRQFRKMA